MTDTVLVWDSRCRYGSFLKPLQRVEGCSISATAGGPIAMVVIKLLGLLLIILALMALGADGLRSLEQGQIEIRSLSQLWTLLLPDLYASFTSWSASALPAGMVTARDAVLSFPAWAVLGILGIVIAGLVRLADR